MKTGTLNIDGMHCGSCVRRVRKALEKLEGLTGCDVEIGKAKVSFDEAKVDLPKMQAALRYAGYVVVGDIG